MMKRLIAFTFILSLLLQGNAQNNYVYKIIDTTIIPDSTLYGASIDIDINADSISDMSIYYVYVQIGDSVQFEDTTLYYEDTMDIASIMFEDDSLAFIINEIGDNYADSTFNILPQDSFFLLDSNAYWSKGLAQAYNLDFGKKIITNADIKYTGANFNQGLKYVGFRIYKTIGGVTGWHYGWLRIEHRDAYFHIYDYYVNKAADTAVRIGYF